jgi:hypothetical protein
MMRRVFALMRLRFMFGGMAMDWPGRHFPKPLDIVNAWHIGFDIPAAGGHVIQIEALPFRRCVKPRTHADTHRVSQQVDQRVGRAGFQRASRGWHTVGVRKLGL